MLPGVDRPAPSLLDDAARWEPVVNRRVFLVSLAGGLPAAPRPCADSRAAKKWRLPGRHHMIAAVLVLVFSGCASLSCQQTSITVAKKEERGRLETIPRGYTAETGGLEEIRRPEIARDYWVQDAEGTWNRVSVEQYRAAVVGQVLELCR